MPAPLFILVLYTRYHSPVASAMHDAIIILGTIFLSAFPFILREIVSDKAKRARRKIHKAELIDPFWKNLPDQKIILEFYPKVLSSIACMDISDLHPFLTDRFIKIYQRKFKKWKRQRIGYAFVWINIEHVEIIGVVDEIDNNQDKIKIYVGGQNLDYMHEKGSIAAMGAYTRRKKEFQDILTFKRKGNSWLLDNVQKDVWLWQI